MGRPSNEQIRQNMVKYQKAQDLAETGMTAKEACERVGVRTENFYAWEKRRRDKPKKQEAKAQVTIHELPRKAKKVKATKVVELQNTSRLTVISCDTNNLEAVLAALGRP